MNMFFAFNLTFTLTMCIPLLGFDMSTEFISDYIAKFVIVSLIAVFCWIRGRKSVEVRKEYLYVNSYPFFKRFALASVSSISLVGKKVCVHLTDKSSVEIDFFFNPQNAVDQSATKLLLKS